MQRSYRLIWSVLLCAMLAFFSYPFYVSAEEKEIKSSRLEGPERGIGLFTEYTGITVARGESVRTELVLVNKGRHHETISVMLTNIPKGWKATLRGGSYSVSGLYVPPDSSKRVTLQLDPEKNTAPGNYTFSMEAATSDNAYRVTHEFTVKMGAVGTESSDLQISTSYPVLRGPTDSKFEFSLEITNKSEADRTVNINATAPEKWEVNVKPAYEEKHISSFRIRGGQSQTVSVQVTPPNGAAVGQYPIHVRIGSGERQTDVPLAVILTGIYKLEVTTTTGLLSLDAIAGETASFSFLIKNTGSAAIRNISMDAFKPENWIVEFKPEKLDVLQPGEMKQITATVKPNAQALVGDYSVGISVEGEKVNKTLEMRVTVKSSSVWGWIGVGIILFVIAGLCSLFVWFGRR